MRLVLVGTLLVAIATPLLAVGAPRVAAQEADPWSLIAEVNALRASYGLAPYEVNNALMAAAQGHSEYQAQIGQWTHSGQGGSRPHDRAVAAGYGGGAQVYVSENVALGSSIGAHEVVYQMWQDAVHLETMISPNYRHIGAGVASAGGTTYFTIDVGYIAGDPGDGPQPPAGTPGTGGTPAATAIALVPIQVATPRPDGAIIHVVQYGQFLINIAEAYEMPLNNLLAANYLTDQTVIFPGDKLIIQPSGTPVETQAATGTEQSTEGRHTPTPSRATPTAKPPTRTPTPIQATPVAMAVVDGSRPDSASASVMQPPPVPTRSGPDYLLITVLVIGGLGLALVLFGNALKRA